MRLALDSNRYRDLCDGDTETVELLETAARIYLPIVVLGELRAGFAWGNRGRENENVLQRFLAKPKVAILPVSEATTSFYGRLYAQLRRQGTPIPTNDLWIAALVVEHNLSLASRDRHFRHLSQLHVV